MDLILKNPSQFDFDTFKNRNLEISKNNLNSNSKLNSKTKSKNKQKEEGQENEEKENKDLEEMQEFDQKLLAQLNKHIQEDKSFFTEQGKKMNQATNANSNNSDDKFKEDKNEEESENKFDGVLVKRPLKGFVWGMGNQANKKKCNKKIKIINIIFSFNKSSLSVYFLGAIFIS